MTDMNMNLVLWVHFTAMQYQEFMRAIEGDGGGQTFVRKCQDLMNRRTRVLELHGEDVEKWFRYRDDYGSGGFQSRMGRQPVQDSLLK